LFLKDWITGQVTPTKPLRALAGTPTARDDTVYSLVDLFRGNLSTSKHLSTDFTRECQFTNSIKELDESELV